MATTPFEKLYENLLPKFKSYEIPFMTEDEVKEELHDYILPAAAMFHNCKKDLSKRDDENECFEEELTDKEIDIICNFMIIKYVDANYVLTPTLLKVNLTSSDFHAFSNANLLDKLIAMQKHYRWENDTLISQYGWINSPCDTDAISKLKKSAGSKRSTL